MNIYHQIARKDCLSHQLWPHFKKGWPETDKIVHFFWGLGDGQTEDIRQCINKKEEWWFVDTGYITEQITRYPSPIIHDYDKTYFRICKGGIHTNLGRVGSGQRLTELEHKGIDVEFKGWYTGKTKHILLAPSSQTVTYHMNGISQEEWIKIAKQEIKKYTDRPIKFRNKPRPNNEWWQTDIKDDLKDAHCLVTNMSLSGVNALMNMVPVFAEGSSIMGPVSSRDISKIEKPLRPGRKTMQEWLKFVAENQFTIKEIENGTAYKTLKVQNED